MTIDKTRRGLVRSVLIITQSQGSFEDIKAYTMWHRHDEPDLERKLRADTFRLKNAYLDSDKVKCIDIVQEWKDYGTL